MKVDVRELYKQYGELDQKEVVLHGWVRNNRAQKEFGFINLNDGTFFETIQVVYESGFLPNFKDVQKYRVGSSIKVKGVLVVTPNNKQPFEIKAREVVLMGDSLEDYPIQPKRHTREFLRENAPHKKRLKPIISQPSHKNLSSFRYTALFVHHKTDSFAFLQQAKLFHHVRRSVEPLGL